MSETEERRRASDHQHGEVQEFLTYGRIERKKPTWHNCCSAGRWPTQLPIGRAHSRALPVGRRAPANNNNSLIKFFLSIIDRTLKTQPCQNVRTTSDFECLIHKAILNIEQIRYHPIACAKIDRFTTNPMRTTEAPDSTCSTTYDKDQKHHDLRVATANQNDQLNEPATWCCGHGGTS